MASKGFALVILMAEPPPSLVNRLLPIPNGGAENLVINIHERMNDLFTFLL
jgi:hypothetical protein